jgi:transcriptional regulator with GAF, ATPase, and Fis domain
MQEVVRLARSVAVAHSTVLLLGESGTGKEVMARAIHYWSPRAEQPFVAVNCVALTPELLESELFGHEKGAFTGAVAQKKGKFELANQGTIFLDEIGDLAPHLQAKLLRVLQEREFQHVGGTKDIRVDVRVIAATNRDLRRAMQNGTFREDLYYRLNVVSISLPPLRDRREEIPALIEHFTARYCHEMKRPLLAVDPQALELLHTYRWPGNVRELQNVIERAVVLSQGPAITVSDLPLELRTRGEQSDPTLPGQAIDPSLPLSAAMEMFKRIRVHQALEAMKGNQTKAAQVLGLPRPNLSRLMKQLGLR